MAAKCCWAIIKSIVFIILNFITISLKTPLLNKTDSSGLTRRGKGDICSPSATLWGRQIVVGMLHTNYEMSNVSGC